MFGPHQFFRGKSAVAALTITAATIAVPGTMHAQFPPDSLVNIQELPKDITVQQLIGVMRGFAGALGVRCQYCHVGEAGQPLSAFDFPSDEKETKRKARVMLRMLGRINGEHLAELETRGEPEVVVECATCHRGQTRPRMTDDVLRQAYTDGGIDDMIARYRELHERYYGSHTYDFRWFILNNLAAELGRSGEMADAEALLSLNLEFFPDEPRVRVAYALTSVESALIAGGPDAGVARFRELQEQFPAGPATENQLNSLGYRLMGRELLPAAIAIFKLNVEINPESSNVYDSLGEAYMNNGETDLAIRNYERSLELNADNANAVQTLERLRSN